MSCLRVTSVGNRLFAKKAHKAYKCHQYISFLTTSSSMKEIDEIPIGIPDYDDLPLPPSYVTEDEEGNIEQEQIIIENVNETTEILLDLSSDSLSINDNSNKDCLILDKMSNTQLPAVIQHRFSDAITFQIANDMEFNNSLVMSNNHLSTLEYKSDEQLSNLEYSNMAYPPWMLDPNFIEPRRDENNLLKYTQYPEICSAQKMDVLNDNEITFLTHEEKVMKQNKKRRDLENQKKQNEYLTKRNEKKNIESLSVVNDTKLQFRLKIILVFIAIFLYVKYRLNNGFFYWNEYGYKNVDDEKRNERLAKLNVKYRT